MSRADGNEVNQRERGGSEAGSRGLQGGAIGFISNVVIGIASVSPGYSLATTLGFIAVAVGFHSPAVLWLAFVPMLLIAAAYYYMNQADPDCGTSFSWVTISMGPYKPVWNKPGFRVVDRIVNWIVTGDPDMP